MMPMRAIRGLIFFAILLGLRLSGSTAVLAQPVDSSTSSTERIIHFPGNEPVGKYRFVDPPIFDHYWEHLMEYGEYRDAEAPDAAMGEVRVPPGKGLMLWMDYSPPAANFGTGWYPYKKSEPPKLSIFSTFQPNDIQALDLTSFSFQEHEMAHVGRLIGIRALTLRHTNLSDEDLLYLKPLRSLNYLDLGCTPITNQGLVTLQELKSLTGLAIEGCTQITDQGLAALAGMPQLKHLSLVGSLYSDAGMAHLRNLTGLESLELGGNITDAGLAALEGLKNLKELKLFQSAGSDAGLAHLAPLSQLRRLWVDALGDEGIRQLSRLPALEFLYISVAKMTPACIPDLKRMRALKTLQITGCSEGKNPDELRQREALLKMLHEALPECRIFQGNIIDKGTAYPPPDWRPEFEDRYSLRPGEVVRRVPNIENGFNYARTQFIKRDYPNFQGSSFPILCYKTKNSWQWLLDKAFRTVNVSSLAQAIGNIHDYQVLDSIAVQEQTIHTTPPPDWVVDMDSSTTLRLAALEKILREHLGLKVHFEYQNKTRDVAVLSGRTSLDAQAHRSLDIARIRPVIRLSLSDVKPSTPRLLRNFTFSSLHSALKTITHDPVLNQTTFFEDAHFDIETTIPPDAFDEKVAPDVRRARLKELLDSLARQTGLHYAIESQQMETWEVIQR